MDKDIEKYAAAKTIFGFNLSIANSYDDISWDNWFMGGETGTNTAGILWKSDGNSIINFGIILPSQWWKIWQWKFSVQVNIGNGGFSIGWSPFETSIAISANNMTVEIFLGLNKIGFTVSETFSFANLEFGKYTSVYIRTLSALLMFLVVYATGGVGAVTIPA